MEAGRTPIEEAISHAVLAGAYAALIREIPETARGFGRLHEKHHAAGAEAVSEICDAQGLTGRQAGPGRRHVGEPA